jgi:hypothetical protein
MDQQKFLGLLDMLDGGGAGRSGQTFEGGPLSGFLNALGVRPQGYQERMEREREPMYLAGPPSRPTPMYSAGPPSVPPNPYAPGAITTTTLPPMGQMSDEALMKIIYDAMQRAQSGQRR